MKNVVRGKNHFDAIQKGVQILRDSNLLADTFAGVVLEDKLACQHVIRTILKRDDIEIIESKAQYRLLNPPSKDAILDVLAQDSSGRLINIEIQRRDDIDHARRTRFYASMIDKSCLDRGLDYAEFPDVYVIYISEHDLYKTGEVLCPVHKMLGSTNRPYDDGSYVIYANTAIDDGSKVARMLQYFKTADPTDMSQGDLSKRVRFIKQEQEGCEHMDKAAEYLLKEGKEIANLEAIESMMEKLNFSAEKAMDILGIPVEERPEYLAML